MFDAAKFLVDFGYLPDKDSINDPAAFSAAVSAAQATYGLDPTGELTGPVERVWERTPRCGCTDAPHARNFVPRWGITHLRYHWQQYPVGLGLTPADVRRIARESYDSITAVTGLTFEEVNRPEDANLVWRTGRGGRAGFDGPGGTLAYHYLPNSNNYRGQLLGVLDLDEPWTATRQRNGILLLNVLTHETLHGLGLDHVTMVRLQLMNPTYAPDIGVPQSGWDIPQLHQRYGPAKQPVNPPASQPASPPTGSTLPDKLEILLRFNGRDVVGPQEIDLGARKLTVEW